MGTDLGTVNKRLNQIIALLDSHANLSEVAKNTYVATGQTVLPCTSWVAELQTANADLDYTYQTAFPHPLYAAAEEDNTVYHLHSFMWEFPITNLGWEQADISAMSYSQTYRILGRPAIVQWDDNNVFLSHPSSAESLTVNTDPEIDKNTILSGLPERFDIVARWEDNWDERGIVPVRSALAFSRQLPQIGLYYSYASPQLDEAEQIKSWYRNEVSEIPEVEQIVYTQYEKSIEFVVVVDSIERDLFYHLSQIESQLCDQYTDWIFEFETIGPRTFSQQSRDGYTNLFRRD